MYEHEVRGRLNSNGQWKTIYPENFTTKTEWWLFNLLKYSYKVPNRKIDRETAVKLAQELYQNNHDYQDIIVLRENGGDSMGNLYCPTVIWKNGKWINYSIDTELYKCCGN